MRYPMMKGGGQYRVEIPQLAGGVNLSDLPTQVEDNQLTDVCNMWWHRGVLRTRPGLKCIGERDVTGNVLNRCRISEREEIVFYAEDGDDEHVNVRADVFSVDGTYTLRRFEMYSDKNHRTALGVRIENEDSPYLIFTGDGEILHSTPETTMLVEKPYIPTVTVERRNEDGSVSNILFEDYNMLTPQFKCSFSTDGERTRFYLPTQELDRTDVTVTLTIRTSEETSEEASKGIKTVDVVVPEPSEWTDIGRALISDVGSEPFDFADPEFVISSYIVVELNYKTGELFISGQAFLDDGEGSHAKVFDKALVGVSSNNVVVTANKTQEGQRDTICRMTKAVWFGGTRSGLDGGTRLFVTGNPSKPNLVHWSDINNPFYFPENNYFYVGDTDQRVTGFGKQGELLVIFKEREIYCSQYVAGSTITKDDLISGAVTDIASLTAQFPLTPLHPTIGCDCPDTIRLVNNRLVWATSNAHVYMLPSVNQYSERNVRDITALVRARLEQHEAAELKQATATEYMGHYMLILPDGTAYLLDVGNSAFQSFAYYASEKKANRALPWYIWKLGKEGERFLAAVSTGDELRLLASDGIGREYTFDGDTDEGEPISCSFSTKLFDFGRADRRKAVTQAYIRIGNGDGGTVRVSYVTDCYTIEDAYIIENDGSGEERSADYLRPYWLTPNAHRVRLFGLRCDSDGAMAVEGIGLNYSIQGVIR